MPELAKNIGENIVIERQIDIATKDGASSTFIVHPDRGGPFPVIIFLMDAPAIREEFRDMARRFASSGYYVMLPNLYYRSGVMEIGPLSQDPKDPSRIAHVRPDEHARHLDDHGRRRRA